MPCVHLYLVTYRHATECTLLLLVVKALTNGVQTPDVKPSNFLPVEATTQFASNAHMSERSWVVGVYAFSVHWCLSAP